MVLGSGRSIRTMGIPLGVASYAGSDRAILEAVVHGWCDGAHGLFGRKNANMMPGAALTRQVR